MIHEVPESYNLQVQSSVQVPIEELLPVKGPDVSSFDVEARYENFEGVVYSAAHNINLRSEPTVLSDVVSKVPLGQPVTVLEQSKEAELGGRQDHWYHISTTINGVEHTGYLFASTLTPHRFDLDFDGDGVDETIVVSFNNNYSLLFRLHDPNDSNPYSWVNMGEYTEKQGEEVLTAQNATLRIYPEEIAGQVLFRVDVDCPDECFDQPKHWVKFASYSSGKFQRALEYEESEAEDRFSSVHLDFQRHKKSLLLSRVSGTVQADHSIQQDRSVEIWDLYTGVYRLRSTSQVQKEQIPPPVALMTDPTIWASDMNQKKEEITFSSVVPSQAKSSEINTEKNKDIVAPKPSQDVKNIKKDSSQDIKSSNKEEQPNVVRNEPKENIAKEEKIEKEEILPKDTAPSKNKMSSSQLSTTPQPKKNIQPKRSKPDSLSKVKKIETQDSETEKNSSNNSKSTESKEVHSLQKPIIKPSLIKKTTDSADNEEDFDPFIRPKNNP